MKRRFFAVLLSVMLVMCMMPSMAFAEGEVPNGADPDASVDEIVDAPDDATDEVLEEPEAEEEPTEEAVPEDVQETEEQAEEPALDSAEEVAEPEETAEEVTEEAVSEDVQEPEEAIEEPQAEPEEAVEETEEESFYPRSDFSSKDFKKLTDKKTEAPNGVIVLYKKGKVNTFTLPGKTANNVEGVSIAKSFGSGMTSIGGGKDQAKATLQDQKKILDKALKSYTIKDTLIFKQELSKATGPVLKTDTVVSLVSSSKYSPEKLAELLNGLDEVVLAEPNYHCYALGEPGTGTGDPYAKYAYQTKVMNTQVLKDQIPASSDDDVVVAILDSGVDYTHEELMDTMWVNPGYKDLNGTYGYDFVYKDSDPMDENGHGTHCAGIIAAQTKNDIGTIGVAGDVPNVKIMALRFLDEGGSGDFMDAIQAYCYISRAIDDGVNVRAVNNSWGGAAPSGIFNKVLDLVGEKGALSFIASGNESQDNDYNYDSPGNEPSLYTVVVDSVNENMELASYSSFGRKNTDVGAPGTNIISSVSYTNYTPYLYTKEKLEETTSYYGEFDETTVIDADGNVTPTVGTDINGESNEGSVKQFGKSVMKSSLVKGSEGTMELSLGEPSSFNFNGDSRADSTSRTLNWKISNPSVGDVYTLFFPYEKESGIGIQETYTNVAFHAIDETGASPYCGIFMRGDVGYSKEDSNTGNISVDELPFYLMDDEAYSFLGAVDSTFDDIYSASGSFARNSEYVETHYTKYGVGIMIKISEECNGIEDNPACITFCFDSLGVSKKSADPDEFGYYDLYSGTSMATPAACAAGALVAAAYPDSDALDVKAQVLANTTQTDDLYDKCSTGGYIDFTNFDVTAPDAAILDCDVQFTKNTVTLYGKNLGTEKGSVYYERPLSGLEGEIDPANLTWSKDKIVIKNAADLISADVTFKVTTAKGRTSQSAFYTVKGENLYEKVATFTYSNFSDDFEDWHKKLGDLDAETVRKKYEAGARDEITELLSLLIYFSQPEFLPVVGGDMLYLTDESGNIMYLDETSQEDLDDEDYSEAMQKFPAKATRLSDKDVNTKSITVNVNGEEVTLPSYSLYEFSNIASLITETPNYKKWIETESSVGASPEWTMNIYPVSNAVFYDNKFYEEIRIDLSGRTIYALVSFDPMEEDYTKQLKVVYDSTISDIPEGLEKIASSASIAALNGKLYLVGGCGGEDVDFTEFMNTRTFVLDPNAAKPVWKDTGASFELDPYEEISFEGTDLEGTDLGVAGGTAIAQNGKLYYVLGYDMSNFVINALMNDTIDGFNNYIYEFDGSNWNILTELPPQTRADLFRTAAVGITKNGLIFGGLSTDGGGDTFVINTSTGKVQKMNYAVTGGVYEEMGVGTTVGNELYFIDQELNTDLDTEYVINKVPFKNSGYNTLTYTKSGAGSGTVSGISTYTKGETVPVTVKADSTSYIKAIYVDGTKVCGALSKGKAKTIKVATSKDNHTVKVEFGSYLISKAKVKLGYKSTTYTGKVRKPKVTVTLNGKTLKKNTDYTVTYKNNKKIGKASVIVKGKGKYLKSKTATFKILPKKVTKLALTAGTKSLKLTYKKVSGGVKYKVAYRVKGAKKWTYKTFKTNKVTLKKLKSGKTYQVKVRAFKVVKGKTYSGKWSKIGKAKVK